MFGSQWTYERTETLKTLWNEGFSASEIAKRLEGLSRNAVLGKAWRLGLPMRKPVITAVKARVVNGETVTFTVTGNPNKRPKFKDPDAELSKYLRKFGVEKIELLLEQITTAVGFFDIALGQCRWPLGDSKNLEEFKFCGAEAIKEYPYCKRHCRISYKPPRVQNAPAQ